MRFYYRTFCQMAYHFGRQVGHDSRIEVDYRKLAECFKLVEKNVRLLRPTYVPALGLAPPSNQC